MAQSAQRSHRFSLALGLLSLIGCGDFTIQTSSSRTIHTDGYRFDFAGEKATHNDGGEFADDAVAIVVENQFGDVTVTTTEDAPRWEWKLTCWADAATTAKKYTSSVKLETDVKDGKYSWKLVMPKAAVDDLRGVESNLALFCPDRRAR